MRPGSANRLTVLAMIPDDEDRRSLDQILTRSVWKMRPASTLEQGQAALESGDIGVIVTDPDLPDGCCWIDIANAAHRVAFPPNVIVTSALGDDRLWAEVLNLGGFDLLLKPFHPREVLHSVSMAWRCSRDKAILANLLRPEIIAKSVEASSKELLQSAQS